MAIPSRQASEGDLEQSAGFQRGMSSLIRLSGGQGGHGMAVVDQVWALDARCEDLDRTTRGGNGLRFLAAGEKSGASDREQFYLQVVEARLLAQPDRPLQGGERIFGFTTVKMK
jgi:hypothetical protein